MKRIALAALLALLVFDLSGQSAASGGRRVQTFTLAINANVKGAQVFINGVLKGNAPYSESLATGSYTVEVKLKGYRDFLQKVDLSANTTINAVLQPDTFNLNVSADVKGAQVYIDGKLQGNAPLVLALAPGNYSVMVKAAGYMDFLQQVVLNRDLAVQAKLVPAEIQISISSNVKDAQTDIFVNGKLEGKGPLALKLVPGEYQIILQAKGYVDVRDKIVVAPGGKTIFSYAMQPMTFVVNFAVNAPKASLFVDGKLVGTVGAKAAGFPLAAGERLIAIKADGFEDFSVRINVEKQDSFFFELKELMALLSLELPASLLNPFVKNPHASIEVYVDGVKLDKGKIRGSTAAGDFSYEVKPGKHEVVLVSGGLAISGTFFFEAGKVYAYTPSLKLEPAK
jgi:hypothetical protein